VWLCPAPFAATFCLAYGPLIASLILGVLRGVWHLPLFAVGLIPWYDVVFLSLAMQFIASWLYNRTRGSLPVVMFFHLASNVAGVIMPLLFTGADLTAHSRLFVALACLCALVVVGVAGPALGVRQQPPFEGKVAEPLPQARKGKRRLGWGKRLLTWFLGVVMALAGAGVVYQQIGTALDRRFYGPPGQLVNVGGYKLHLHCLGQGSPTVILDHVGATNSAQWALIQPQVATQTRVCAYDRAGFGWSEPGPGPRDAAHNAQELHTLLANAGIEGPYLFVGHSFGANVARIYAATYPDEITGLVLVDPGLLSGRPEVPAEVAAQWETQEDGFMQIAPWLARFGIIRLAGALGALPGHGDLPSPQAEAFDAWQRTNQFYVTLKAQYRAMGATSAQVLAAEATLGDMPLIVLSAAQPEQNRSRKVWTSVNAGLAARSANGVHTVVPGSDHMSLALRREDAQVTTSAILEIVEAVRTERPLSWEGSR
jgi:pimeloyl-ACP methyl ester carboxylesterase